MAVTVKIPTQLRSVTGGESEAAVDDAPTVGEVLDGLYDRFDGLRERIAVDGDLRRFVNVYVGGEDIRFLDGLETPVEDGDEVTILPAVAGGERKGPRDRARPSLSHYPSSSRFFSLAGDFDWPLHLPRGCEAVLWDTILFLLTPWALFY